MVYWPVDNHEAGWIEGEVDSVEELKAFHQHPTNAGGEEVVQHAGHHLTAHLLDWDREKECWDESKEDVSERQVLCVFIPLTYIGELEHVPVKEEDEEEMGQEEGDTQLLGDRDAWAGLHTPARKFSAA